jgi:NADPH-dependent ferric siderophore reductase
VSYDASWFRAVRHPLKARRLRVTSVTSLSPRMTRVVLTGPDLEGFTSLAPEDHVKLFFPRPGEGRPELPMVGPLGIVLPRPGAGKLQSRDYTPHGFDAARQELSIDFFLHGGEGIASSWVERAKPGDELGVLGPRGSYVTSERFGEYLLVGDETALPEIEGRLRLLEAGAQARVILVVSSELEQRALSSPAELDIRWVYRKGNVGGELARAVVESVPRTFMGFAWLAGEAAEVRGAYDFLVRVRGLERRRVHASGHWKRGVENHDHHSAIDVLGDDER